MDTPRVLLDGEPMESATEAEDTASALDFLLEASFRISFVGNVGVEVDISPDDLDLPSRRITDA